MLQGKKVILRAIERQDLTTVWVFNNSLAVELAGGGDPPEPQSLARLTAEWESQSGNGGRDGMSFGIEADQQLIGICALFNVDHNAHTSELGITIGNPDYWGQGYGRDVIRLLLHYGFNHRNMHKIYLRVHAKNVRGVRAYRACGFVEEGRLRQHVWSDGAYDDLIMMGILRSAWESAVLDS